MPERTEIGEPSMFSLAGRVAAVTGASSGIGAAIAEGLAKAGATVFGLSRRVAGPAGILPIRCDLEQTAEIVAAFAEIGRRSEALSVLVNAAGLSLPPPGEGLAAELSRFRRTLEVDLVAAYACAVEARRLMRRGGAIINVTSINAVRGFPGNPGYVAAKSGLAGLTRALAVDFSADGIRVNALGPGYVHTAMTDASHRDPQMHEQRRQHTILGRWGTPQDLVGAAVFLASDASAYVTGQEIYVDGGWTAQGLVNAGGARKP